MNLAVNVEAENESIPVGKGAEDLVKVCAIQLIRHGQYPCGGQTGEIAVQIQRSMHSTSKVT